MTHSFASLACSFVFKLNVGIHQPFGIRKIKKSPIKHSILSPLDLSKRCLYAGFIPLIQKKIVSPMLKEFTSDSPLLLLSFYLYDLSPLTYPLCNRRNALGITHSCICFSCNCRERYTS